MIFDEKTTKYLGNYQFGLRYAFISVNLCAMKANFVILMLNAYQSPY